MSIFMEFTGKRSGKAKGDATAASHEKWITLTGVQWGCARPTEAAGKGANRATGALGVNQVTITKMQSASTGPLVQAHFDNEPGTAIIEWTLTSDAGTACYGRMKLTDTTITSYSLSSEDKEDDGVETNPVETFKIAFTQIDIEYFDRPKKGTKPADPYGVQWKWNHV